VDVAVDHAELLLLDVTRARRLLGNRHRYTSSTT
jgi:hypothetical protein